MIWQWAAAHSWYRRAAISPSAWPRRPRHGHLAVALIHNSIHCSGCAIPKSGWLGHVRLVADRCLYGVDKNPLAVEMAKLSLWLITLQKDRPFSFLDHALRAGDSLLGIAHVDQLLDWSLARKTGPTTATFLTEPLRRALQRAITLRPQDPRDTSAGRARR